MDTIKQNISSLIGNGFLDAIRQMVNACLPQHASAMEAKLTVAKLNVEEYIEQWNQEVNDPATVQYGKAFARLAGRPITVRDVISYRDIDSLVQSGLPQRALKIDFGIKDVKHEGLADLWEAVDTACRLASMRATLNDDVRIPTRDEIAANIKSHKKAKARATPKIGVHEARNETIKQALIELCNGSSVPPPKLPHNCNDTCDKLFSTTHENATYGEHATSGDTKALATCPFPTDWGIPSSVTSQNSDAWTKFAQAVAKSYNLHKMQQSIPANMMNQIEKQAMDIAAGMESGNMDLGSMNIGSIGESVLQECSAADLEQLSSNMGSILPNLNTLASTLQSDAGANLPGDVGAILKTASALGSQS